MRSLCGFLVLCAAMQVVGAQALSFRSVREGASARAIPTRILDEVISATAGNPVTLVKGSWPAYDAGRRVITLPAEHFSTAVVEWGASLWSSFMNEAFHAWWNTVFTRQTGYRAQYDLLTTRYKKKYRAANYWNPILAQEEAYSETLASVTLLWAHRVPEERLYYRTGYTVEPVGHSDRPGYSPEAEDIYPDQYEYNCLYQWVFARPAPAVPVWELFEY